MENIQFQGVDLAELLPRIPDAIKNGLPFGLVKLDLQGTILEYNMAEGTMTGVDPNWALGKNFFDDVALCTKTQAFYGRFVEGVKRGFMNTVFDYVFDHRDEGVRVKVHMVMVPDHLGRKQVMLLVKRVDQPKVRDATPEWPPREDSDFQGTKPAALDAPAPPAPMAAAKPIPAGAETPSIRDIVEAVMAILHESGKAGTAQEIAQAAVGHLKGAAAAPAAAPVPAPAPAPAPAPSGGASKHADIFKL